MQDDLLRKKKLPELREIANNMGIELPKSFLKKEDLITLISADGKANGGDVNNTASPEVVHSDEGRARRRGRRGRTQEEVEVGQDAVAKDSSSEAQQQNNGDGSSTPVEPNRAEGVQNQEAGRRGRRPRKNAAEGGAETPQNQGNNNRGGEPTREQRENRERNDSRSDREPREQREAREPRDNREQNGNSQSQDKNFDNRKKANNKNRREKNGGFNAQSDFTGIIECTGSLEMVPDGYGFLRSADYNYINSPDDVYVGANQIKQYGLKQGDTIQGIIRPPREGDKFFPLSKIIKINGLTPEEARDRIQFEFLTPLFPDEKFNITGPGHNNISNRIVDMFSPIGKGQRALIVAQPKTGKTILLKDLANAIADSHPDVYMIMLLIDERPEEVTDMARSVNAEVIASTFDEQASKHVKVAEMVLEKAKRLVECGHDVVIMLDSITRLARAYNTVQPTSNKILSGGVDAAALHKPKRFFGAARNTEERGSLTIIATALIDTGSKMDEVIFEEFKGTGNMELQLDRKLSNRRIYPAVDITASSTRRDDLLQDKDLQQKMWILRRHLSDMSSIEAMEFVKKHLENTRNNDEFFKMMNQ